MPACVALLATYAALAWTAVGRESPTFDEPYHALSAWVQWHRHDYRIDNEDPPLWQYWASLPNGGGAVRPDFNAVAWRGMATEIGLQWRWTVDTLYRTPGTDGAAVIGRCRAMMLVVAVGLGVAIAAWAGRLGGPTAAVVATAAFAFDPNFLAHGPLMKNDVAAALAWLGVTWAAWDVGRRVTVGSALRMAVLAAVPILVKFSGLLTVVLVPTTLLLRATAATPWPVLGRTVTTWRGRLATAAGLAGLAAVTAYAGVWAAYGFRYRSGPAADDRLDLRPLIERATTNSQAAHPGRAGTPLAVGAAAFADRHHLLPEPFVAGFLFTYGESQLRPAYLLGDVSGTGWWYYFPIAVGVKTPTATLAALAGLAMSARRLWRSGRWATTCLAMGAGVYAASALSTNLNIGIRHVLPLYPLAYVAIGWAAAGLLRRGRAARVAVGGLAGLLVVETTLAFPLYLSYFNWSARAASSPSYLLGDSNLDWGQGLVALADWQRGHDGEPLYLSYFGLADPRSFGLHYTPLPGGYRQDLSRPRWPAVGRPCWLAVSVSQVQLAITQPNDDLRRYYLGLAARRPTAVVGGCIYLYHYDPTADR